MRVPTLNLITLHLVAGNLLRAGVFLSLSLSLSLCARARACDIYSKVCQRQQVYWMQSRLPPF